jgi:hypothetical protein
MKKENTTLWVGILGADPFPSLLILNLCKGSQCHLAGYL